MTSPSKFPSLYLSDLTPLTCWEARCFGRMSQFWFPETQTEKGIRVKVVTGEVTSEIQTRCEDVRQGGAGEGHAIA